MRRRTLALLQAAFSTVLASCAQPPPVVTPSEPSAPNAPPTQEPVSTAAPLPMAAATTPTPPVVAPPSPPKPDRTAPTFVEGNPNTRSSSQLCPGNLIPSLRPGRPVDSLEMRVIRETNERVEIVVMGRAGSPCGTAKDHAACQRAFEAALPPLSQEILVFTRGDEVGVVTRGEIPAFLAPIDSPEEAAAATVYGPPGTETAISCDAAQYKATPSGYTSTQRRDGRCEHDVFTFGIGKNGKARVVSKQHVVDQNPCRQAVKGRRPEGLAPVLPVDGESPGSLGAYLAEACTLEAASVTSFRRLERELAALGAPRSLRHRAKASARDEARHARTMRRLARRAGIEPRKPRVARIAPRAALAIAIENAVEGCVLETWAALVARFQAEHAVDADFREAMRIIAEDEARHAALAWDVRTWLETRLSPEEQAHVRDAYEQALADLVRGRDTDFDEPTRAALGLPSPQTAQTLATAWASWASA